MRIQEAGVLPPSVRFFFTPSSFAERVFLYPTRVGRYFCDRRYQFSSSCEIALQAGHHLHYMIMLIKRGALEFTIETARCRAGAEQMALFDCKRPHQYAAASDDLEFYWLVCNGSPMAALYKEILALHGGSHVFGIADPAAAQTALLRLLRAEERESRLSERAAAETIYALLCRMLTSGAAAESGLEALLKRSVEYMNRNFSAALSVDEVAAHVGLSSSYFTKRFRAHTGYSPHEYLTLRRIDRAKELLLTGDQTVKQIAFEIGYNSEENFIRAFKKKTGLPPGVFRQYPL